MEKLVEGRRDRFSLDRINRTAIPIWKLAGVNFTVDGPYNTNETGAGFLAAIFDEGGLYKGGEGNWTRRSESVAGVPGGFYATRISVRLDWINSVLAQPPTADLPVLQSSPSVNGSYTNETSAVINQGTKVIALAQPFEQRFYRLSGPAALRITEIKVQAGNLVLRYE